MPVQSSYNFQVASDNSADSGQIVDMAVVAQYLRDGYKDAGDLLFFFVHCIRVKEESLSI